MVIKLFLCHFTRFIFPFLYYCTMVLCIVSSFFLSNLPNGERTKKKLIQVDYTVLYAKCAILFGEIFRADTAKCTQCISRTGHKNCQIVLFTATLIQMYAVLLHNLYNAEMYRRNLQNWKIQIIYCRIPFFFFLLFILTQYCMLNARNKTGFGNRDKVVKGGRKERVYECQCGCGM